MSVPARPCRTEAVPIADMAVHFAGHCPCERDTPERALVLLVESGRFAPSAIAAGLDATLALVRAGAAILIGGGDELTGLLS